MRILAADDDRMTRRLLENLIIKWGHEVVAVADGDSAWRELRSADRPGVAILDWMMSGLDGAQICRKLRELDEPDRPHVILLTARDDTRDIVEGLDAGADDYIVKPFKRDELRARVQVGVRIVELQQRLTAQLAQLKDALNSVKRLEGLLPMCSYCKSIRDDQDYWQQLESYIADHSDAQFSHSICPTCYQHFLEAALDAPDREQP